MSVHIIVDGYNLIRRSHQLREVDRKDLQQGREMLQNYLMAYKKIKGHRITVVYDGTHTSSHSPQRLQERGLNILFSRSNESADRVIKRMAAKEKERAVIISSDREIERFATSKGCATVRSQEFEDRLHQAVYCLEKGIDEDAQNNGWKPTTRKKGPRRRLSKRTRQNQKKICKL